MSLDATEDTVDVKAHILAYIMDLYYTPGEAIALDST